MCSICLRVSSTSSSAALCGETDSLYVTSSDPVKMKKAFSEHQNAHCFLWMSAIKASKTLKSFIFKHDFNLSKK